MATTAEKAICCECAEERSIRRAPRDKTSPTASCMFCGNMTRGRVGPIATCPALCPCCKKVCSGEHINQIHGVAPDNHWGGAKF